MIAYEDPFAVDRLTKVARNGKQVEGLSLVAATELGNQVQTLEQEHYIPAELYELGLVDEFKDLCGLSLNTYNFIVSDLFDILHEKGYHDADKRAMDHASYCTLVARKCASTASKRPKVITSLLPELADFARVLKIPVKVGNNIPIYGNQDSIISLYKNNIVTLLKGYDKFDEGLNGKEIPEEKNHVSINANMIKSVLYDLGLSKAAADSGGGSVKLSQTYIKEESFKPSVTIAHFMDEKFCIDTLTAAILYENNECLLDYDEININNIDNNLRILDIDRNKIKQGILYDLLNGNKKLDEFTKELSLNRVSENTLSFNDLVAYQEEQATVNDPVIYQDYADNNKTTLNKEQNFLITKYLGNRKSYKQKLGNAFKLISYTFEVSSSFLAYQSLKKYAVLSPKVITTRNSYDNYIFPSLFISNQHLFEEYKHLIDQSFKMYNTIIKKGGSYQVAQYANINGVRTNYLISQSLRDFDYILSKETQPGNHLEIREICQGIYNILKLVHPNLAKTLKYINLEDSKPRT